MSQFSEFIPPSQAPTSIPIVAPSDDKSPLKEETTTKPTPKGIL